MSTDLIKDKIKSSVGMIAGIAPDTIPDSAAYAQDLGLDSLMVVEIVIDVENQFGIKIPDVRAQQLRTIDDTVRAVQDFMVPMPA
jgi:acyl carrier protein